MTLVTSRPFYEFISQYFYSNNDKWLEQIRKVARQLEQSLKNIQAILEAEGLTMSNVVKTTVLLQNIADFAAMNEVYAKYFASECPARAAYQVAALPKSALVEIEAIAVV